MEGMRYDTTSPHFRLYFRLFMASMFFTLVMPWICIAGYYMDLFSKDTGLSIFLVGLFIAAILRSVGSRNKKRAEFPNSRDGIEKHE
jgi:hypothetical protein